MSRSVLENLRISATRFPERCALASKDVAVDYATLWRRASAVASFLASSGVRAGDRVALVLENGIEYVVTYYGALMAGAIVVPLNTAAKAKDLAVWLRHCGAKWLFADGANAEVGSALDVLKDVQERPRLVFVGGDDGDATFEALAEGDPSLEWQGGPQAEMPACILYTSGTTGKPKGVLLSHGNLAANAESIVSYLGLGPDDSTVTVLPFFYSYGNSVLHSHLRVGGRVILGANFVYPHAVVDTLAVTRSTGFAGVPATFALLLARVDLSQFDLSALRYVTQAGGPMSSALAERLRTALPDVQVFVMYGQTEATARLTYLPPVELERKMGSVGIPIPGVAIEVRGENGKLASAHEVGDVWARGPNVMLGYWNDEEATQSVLADGWLKTGDMGYLDAEGYLYLKGRRADIIKVGAHRIHPKEIEEVIAELPGVQEVAVVGVQDELLGQVAKAFVVVVPGAAVTPLGVKAFCRERLATYKIPKHLEFLSALPKTASGKVRRLELMEECTQ